MLKSKTSLILCACITLNSGLVNSAVLRYESAHTINGIDDRLPFSKYGIEKPDRPNGSMDSRTISGVDNNYNGVRDSAEIKIYEKLKFVREITKNDYVQTLRVASLMTPIEPIKARSMYPEMITCEYSKLPYYIRSRISEVDLYEIILNNSKRKIAFRNSLAPEKESLYTSC